MATVAIIDDELFDLHVAVGLPERPARVQGIRSALREKFGDSPSVCWLEPRAISQQRLEQIHHPSYVKHVIRQCFKCEEDDSMQSISGDTEVLVGANSLRAIMHAAGAAAQAVQLVLDDANPVTRVFCNVRPPGHHAHAGKGQGFCVFNNIWIAACEARRLGAQRVVIVDWDVHHGNGTQDFVIGDENEADTLFFSIHQHHRTLWPGSGKSTTRGTHGTVHCAEMFPRSGDEEMKQYFDNVLIPKVRQFNANLILISCGFDGHRSDHIAKLRYSSELYGWMTQRLRETAEEFCGGRMVSILEGGYCIPALQNSTVEHINGLI